jgi:hypothetical protein
MASSVILRVSIVQNVQAVQIVFDPIPFKSSIVQWFKNRSTVGARWALLGLYQPSMGAVAIGMIFRLPTAADGHGFRLFKFYHKGLNICRCVGAVAKRQIFAARAAAVRHAL